MWNKFLNYIKILTPIICTTIAACAGTSITNRIISQNTSINNNSNICIQTINNKDIRIDLDQKALIYLSSALRSQKNNIINLYTSKNDLRKLNRNNNQMDSLDNIFNNELSFVDSYLKQINNDGRLKVLNDLK